MSKPDSNKKFLQFKLVLLGESAVGKSSIVHRFVKNSFDDLRESTIGAAFLTQSITIPETQTTIKFEIWDTAGQERYKSLAPMYYRNSHAAIVVYDITKTSSLQRAKDWIEELRKNSSNDGIIIALVGNKLDLQDEREIEQSDVEEYATEQNLLSFECSAKSGEGVHDIFDAIARKLSDKIAVQEVPETRRIDLNRNATANNNNNSCC